MDLNQNYSTQKSEIAQPLELGVLKFQYILYFFLSVNEFSSSHPAPVFKCNTFSESISDSVGASWGFINGFSLQFCIQLGKPGET